MASNRQLLANRANAQKSTGPITEKGKLASRGNAMRHGLTAKALLLEGENLEDFQLLRLDLYQELAPVGRAAEEAFERLVSVIWRMRRIPVFEAAFFECLGNRDNVNHVPPNATLTLALRDVMNYEFLSKLARYEAHLARQYHEAFEELERLRELQAEDNRAASSILRQLRLELHRHNSGAQRATEDVSHHPEATKHEAQRESDAEPRTKETPA